MKDLVNVKITGYSRLFLSVILFLTGCSETEKTELQNKSNTSSQQISQKLSDWNNKQKIKLLKHQLIPIDYLEKNKDVKGLLVFHYLGTGKTFLSIGFAERNPTKKIVLIVPRFLMGHWKKNMSIYGVKDPSRYKIVSHSSPEEILKLDLKNSIVIVDESHRLINKINENNPTISNTYAQLYLKIRSAYKVL